MMEKQPLFGDRAQNYPGNNGYGYEEHEQYVGEKEDTSEKTIVPISVSPDLENDSVICVRAGADRFKVDQLAEYCYINKLGEAFFDDGEDMTEDHIAEQTYAYYENKVPNKSKVFLNLIEEQVPHARVYTQEAYSDDLGDDVTRFLPQELDFEGLDDGLEL